MKSFSDITAFFNISNRKPHIGQVRNDIIGWGKNNRSSRTKVKILLWLDSDDKSDRIVISGEVVLNIKKTAPEKNVDLNLEVSHFSDYDPVNRRLTTSHPEAYFRIDGQLNDAAVKSMYASLCEQISKMELDERHPVTGFKNYIAV